MTTTAPQPDRTPRTGGWQDATVVAVHRETRRAKTIRLAPAEPFDHLAGQHVVVRLTAPDGYAASRSYSIASPPDAQPTIDLTVERLDDGEVSTFLHDVLEVGDTIEVRGPIGGWFVWRGDQPALLVGGGSGLVPLVAMLRLARTTGAEALVHLLASVRSPADLLFADELLAGVPRDSGDVIGLGATVAFTREAPAAHARPAGRLTAADLAAGLDAVANRSPSRDGPAVYVCGSAGFAEHVTDLLRELSVAPERIRVERFGPSA